MFAFLVFFESGLIKSCLSFEDLSAYRMSWFHVDRCKFCIHLSSLNVRHFGMVVATALKVRLRGHLQRHDLPTELHKDLPTGSKVGGGTETQTHRQGGEIISLQSSVRKESRLKVDCFWIILRDLITA
jgi:hypothetical protein